MNDWEDNKNNILLFDYFLLTTTGVIFLRKGKSTTISGHVRVQGQGVTSVNWCSVTIYPVIDNVRGQQSQRISLKKGGFHFINYSLYIGEVTEGEKVNIEVEIATYGTSTARIYTLDQYYHLLDVATTFLDFNLQDDPRWIEDNTTTNPIVTLSTNQMVKTNTTYDDIANPKVNDSIEYYDEINHNLAIVDENNVIKRTKKIKSLVDAIYNAFTPESSFLVSLNDNINFEDGKTKIIFDNLIQNNGNLYQNGELVINYSGTYSLHGTINVYCTRNNVLPVDMTLSVIYNNSLLINTTVTIRHTNMIHNIPVNLSLKLLQGNIIYLELTPGVASNRLFMKEDSYWNCSLIKLTI